MELNESLAEALFDLVSSQKAAQELMTESQRMGVEPDKESDIIKETEIAEKTLGAHFMDFELQLENARTIVDNDLQAARTQGVSAVQIEQTLDKLKKIEEIKKEFTIYRNNIISFRAHLKSNLRDADSALEESVEPQYRNNLLPKVMKFKTRAEGELADNNAMIDNAISNVNTMLVVSTVVALLLAGLLGFFISRSISRPIKKLEKAAIEIGKGKLETRIEVTSRNEFGTLARAFNQMSEGLSKSTISKGFLDNILASMADTLIVVNRDLLISKVNQSALNLLGYEESELKGKNIEMVFAEKSFISTELTDLTGNEIFQNTEKCYRARNGTEIPVSFSASVIKNDDGQNQGIVCVAQDITERKRAAEALAYESHLMQTLMDNIPDAIYFKDTESRYLRVSKNTHLKGIMSTEEAIGKTGFDFYSEDCAREAFEDDQRIVQTGEPLINKEEMEVFPDGSEGWVLTTKVPILDKAGKVTGIVGISRDITERKKIEEAFKRETSLVELLKTVAIAANESESVEDALQICLDKVCRLMKWQYGHVALPAKDFPDELITMPIWYFDDHERFEKVKLQMKDVRFQRGTGLIGRVLESGKAIWIKDVTKDPNFTQKKLAEEAGFKGCFAFPILGQGKVIGVLTFFSGKTAEPDEKLLAVMTSIGTQLGQAISRKQAEEKLLESELRYRLLFENNPNPIIVFDIETLAFLAVNEEAVRLYGYSHEEFREMTIKDIRPPEDLAVLKKVLTQNEAGIDKFYSIRHQKKDGSIIEVDLILEPIHFADKSAKLTLITDVTESKRVKDALEIAARKERAMIENALDVICTIDGQGLFISINPACFKMWGYQPEELIGRQFIDFVTPEDVEKTVAVDADIVSGIQTTDFENRYLHKNGTLVNVRWTSYWSETEQLVFAVAHDITELKRAEEEMQNSRDYLNRIINTVADPIFVKDRQHRMVLVNDAFCQLTKHSREEVIGIDFADHVRTEEGDRLTEIDNLVFETGKEISDQQELTDKYGNRRVQITKKTIYTDLNGEKFIVGVINDITERIKTEEALREKEEKFR
ncbi:MAG TPA: PAS domain S-box protein, partial [Pyrinomonadaceae bacterium]|nr:PAS domain S-box protein [Pyrinomonadaceae bacterium]